jgi:Putative zinc-finger
MRCNPALLGALTDNELHGWRAWRVRRHLAHCPTCQQELATLESLGQTLHAASPLPTRKPIRRPIGIVRPVAATLATACAAALLVARLPEPLETEPRRETETRQESTPPVRVSPSHATPQPHLKTPMTPPSVSPRAGGSPRTQVSRRQVAQRKRHRKHVPVAKAMPQPTHETEQIIVVATIMSPPKPVTVVLDNTDDDGGTIHIESTIPAAYVVAMQKETK